MNTRRIVVGISGASGAVYSQRLIRALLDAEYQVHLIATVNGVRLLSDELGLKGVDLEALAGRPAPAIVHHNVNDVGAAVASGSFRHDGMVIVPCSSTALSMVAHGIGSNLLYRAAAVALKERRPLVLCHRETPLTSIDIDNMARATAAGAIVAPANPGWYLNPRTLDDLVDFVVARLLDLLGVEHDVGSRWGEPDDSNQA